MIKIAKTKYGDIHVYENDWIGSVLLDGKYFEEELVDIALASIKENSNVLDIGANVGVFSKAFLSKKCFVHAFEPQKKLVNLLNKTFEGETAIKIYHNAVGDIPCVKTMNIKDGNGNIFTDNGPINLGGIGIGIGGELVNVIKIDDLKLENVSVLKIDVEGFEKNVIYGAMNMIKKEKPFICFESHHLDLGDKAHILSFLINEGYNCIEKEIDGTRNYICLYKYNKN